MITRFHLAGYAFEREDDRLLLRPTRGYAGYLQVAVGCLALFLALPALGFLSLELGGRAGTILFFLGVPALLVALGVGLYQQKRQMADPIILDRTTDRYLHGDTAICPLSRIEWIALEASNRGGKRVYPVLRDGDRSKPDFGYPVVNWEQEQRFAHEIAEFLNVEVHIVGPGYRLHGPQG